MKCTTVAEYLENLESCKHCDADLNPPNLILQGWGYFYVICDKCQFKNRVWVVDDG